MKVVMTFITTHLITFIMFMGLAYLFASPSSQLAKCGYLDEGAICRVVEVTIMKKISWAYFMSLALTFVTTPYLYKFLKENNNETS